MSYYNTQTGKIISALPSNIPTDIGFIANPTHAQLMDAGWLMAEIVRFVVPEGYVVIAGTRRIEVTGEIPHEEWDVETIAEKEAKDESDYITAAKNDYKFRSLIVIIRALHDDKPTNAQLETVLEDEYRKVTE